MNNMFVWLVISTLTASTVLAGEPTLADEPMGRAQVKSGERVESFFSRSPEDLIAITYHGASFLPPVPAGIAKLDEPGLEGTIAVLNKIRNASGEVVGFATELELPLEGQEGKAGHGTATDWILVLPGRGTLYLAEIERMGEFGEKVMRPLLENGTDWEGEFTQIKTVGRRPDGRGEIKGGTDEFDGASGSFVEIQTYTRVSTTAGELHTTLELRVFFDGGG